MFLSMLRKRILFMLCILGFLLTFSVAASADNIADRTLFPGDITGDGMITAADARAALRISVQLDTYDEAYLMCADADGSYTVTAEDARLLLRIAVQLDSQTPTGTMSGAASAGALQTALRAYLDTRLDGYNGSCGMWLEELQDEAGKSPYEYAVGCGYTGSVSDWVTAVFTADGVPGFRINADSTMTYSPAEGEPQTFGPFSPILTVYTVRFADKDGTVLSEQTVQRGYSATAPETPFHRNEVFTAWDTDYSAVTQSMTVKAVYTEIGVTEDGLPVINIFGDALPETKDELQMELDYFSAEQNFSAYIEIKGQGSSSMRYPKKNFTVKLYKAADYDKKLKIQFSDNWGKQSKYVLKANYIDITHARNIVSARLWGDCVSTRDNYASLPEELRSSPNNGAIDGFPVKVYFNNTYVGRYTLNIPKDKWMTGMDDENENHGMICAEYFYDACMFRAAASIDNVYWTDELHDTTPYLLSRNWSNAVTFVRSSTDYSFKKNLSSYFDVSSLIDYYCFMQFICGSDNMGKNQMFLTYDGGATWIATVYDLDSTWGINWYGDYIDENIDIIHDITSADSKSTNLLYERLTKLFADEISARYAELRKTVLSDENVKKEFTAFAAPFTPELIAQDAVIFPGIPHNKSNTIAFILSFSAKRAALIDALLLPEE